MRDGEMQRSGKVKERKEIWYAGKTKLKMKW